MQEEVTQKTIALVIKAVKLDANILKSAMRMKGTMKAPNPDIRKILKNKEKKCLNINYKSSRLWTIHVAGSIGNLYSL